MKTDILAMLREEQEMRLHGGLYHQTQVKLCYNSNRIEGSRLSEEQICRIFETSTLSTDQGESADVDDIIETVNHCRNGRYAYLEPHGTPERAD